MNPYIAAFICVCGIAGLFYLDRDRSLRPSKALWLPTIYLWVVGSRAASSWFSGSASDSVNSQLDSSPIDTMVYAGLLLAMVAVLSSRWREVSRLLSRNWPILTYLLFCVVSVTWSEHPGIAFKRWVKSLDDLTMVLIVVTDSQPVDALKRLVSRIGFVLLPLSLLFIKYFPLLGRGYSPDGMLMNTGVTTNKNVLGVVLLVVSLGTFWKTVTLWRSKATPDRKRHLWAQGVLLAFGLVLLKMTDSATSLVCFVIGSGFILLANRRAVRMRPARIHLLCIGIVLVAGLILLLGVGGSVAQALGRTSSLSGRTQIWAAVIPAAPNAFVGAGYESFWMSSNVEIFQHNMIGWWHPENLNEAHNGYIEVYLNLGWIGLALIGCILVSGYKRAIAAFKRNPSVGALMLAYVIISPVYAITEAGFRSPDPMWIFLLLAIISSTAITAGFGWETIPSQSRERVPRQISRRREVSAWALQDRSLPQKF